MQSDGLHNLVRWKLNEERFRRSLKRKRTHRHCELKLMKKLSDVYGEEIKLQQASELICQIDGNIESSLELFLLLPERWRKSRFI